MGNMGCHLLATEYNDMTGTVTINNAEIQCGTSDLPALSFINHEQSAHIQSSTFKYSPSNSMLIKNSMNKVVAFNVATEGIIIEGSS